MKINTDDDLVNEPKRVPAIKESKVKRALIIKVRKHRVENVNRNQLANVLDAYAIEGRKVIALNISHDIGGSYEVVSFKDEPTV